MNDKQKRLLQLVKEIDAFCRQHDITYYCAAGTVLGAMRHGGFIPWDDDIDILMTRREFGRFVEAFREDGPQDRTIECYEGNPGHRSTVARYLQEGTTMFCHYHMVGQASAGILIDIFILDPIPADPQAQMDHLAKFFIYSDLVQATLSYANRLPARYDALVEEYQRRADREGRDAAARALSEDLFAADEDRCECYVLRWGSLPFIYPREMMGEPAWLAFEDMMIPVPCRWPEYLAIHYGSGWTDIPYLGSQEVHRTIFRTDAPYQEVFALRDALFDQTQLEQIHADMKRAWRQADRLERPLQDFAAQLQIRSCQQALAQRLAEAGVKAPRDLFHQGDHAGLVRACEPYIALQTSLPFMGAQRHLHYGRWLDPILVPIEEGDLQCLLMSLLYIGRTRTAEKLAGIRERSGQTTEGVQVIRELLRQIYIAAGQYYIGDYEGCMQRTGSIRGSDLIQPLRDYYWLSAVRTDLRPVQAQQLQELAQQEDASDGICKAWADYLWSCGERGEAAARYHELMTRCRNGMFLKDIQAKGLDEHIDLEAAAADPQAEASRRLVQLLHEVTRACEGEGIPYALGPELACFLAAHARVGGGGQTPAGLGSMPQIAEIFVDTAGARHLQQALLAAGREDRQILSWEAGHALKDFALRYIDTGTTWCDLRHPGSWEGQCLGVTIRILRRAGGQRSQRDWYGEYAMNLMDLDPLDRYKVTGRKGKLLRSLVQGKGEEQKRKLRQKAFRRAMAEEGGGEGYYYRTNAPGQAPRDHNLPQNFLTETILLRTDAGTFWAHAPEGSKVTLPDPAKDSIFLQQDPQAAWEGRITAEDIRRYEALAWEDYGRARKKLRGRDRQVRKVWNQLLEAASAR